MAVGTLDELQSSASDTNVDTGDSSNNDDSGDSEDLEQIFVRLVG